MLGQIDIFCLCDKQINEKKIVNDNISHFPFCAYYFTDSILTTMAEHKDDIFQSQTKRKGLSKYVSLTLLAGIERAIWAFCELNIADLMAQYQKPVTALELSQFGENNWNAKFLYRLLRVIADADIINEIDTGSNVPSMNSCQEETVRFQLTDDGLLLTSDHFSKARDLIRASLHPTWTQVMSHFPSLIKSNSSSYDCWEQAFGCSVFEYMTKEENKEFASAFNNSMVAYSHHVVAPLVAAIDFTRFSKLVDTAGGLGTLLSSILEANPNIHGILFDLAHVIESAKTMNLNEFQRKYIEPNRYEFVAGNMFDPETIPIADAYILKHVLHDWNDEKSIEILKSIRSANKALMQRNVTVFIAEMVIFSNGNENWEAHAVDLAVLTAGSKERTLSEYISILKKSGYEFNQLYKTNTEISVIEATTMTEICT
ncbi:hypothetical protein I4U23_000026 [Adineta vaga]|nr:hypothetical protein I4U23_000026 [Adineta vaga]